LVIIPFEDDFFGCSIQGKPVFSGFFRVWHDLLKLFNEVVSKKIQLIEDKINKILFFDKLDSRAENFTAFANFLLLLVVHRRFGVNLSGIRKAFVLDVGFAGLDGEKLFVSLLLIRIVFDWFFLVFFLFLVFLFLIDWFFVLLDII
jgi:hypothetical protein